MKTDREKLIELFNKFTIRFTQEEYYSGKATNERGLEQLADHLLSKGVTIPVRCWECVYYSKTTVVGLDMRCNHPQLDYDVECYDHWLETGPNDFCSYGERKEE